MAKKKVKKVVKKVSKPKAKKVVKPKVKKVVEPKTPVLKSESYCGIKILSISKRKDGAYDVALADGTTTILDERQYKLDVK